MDKKDFGLRLSRLRLKKGISARKMSSLIRQNDGYINTIETGKNYPSMEVFFNICDYLGVTPQEFFDFDSADPSKLNAIIKDMKKLNAQQLDTIATLVKNLAQK